VRIILDTERRVDINVLGGRAHSTALHVSVYRDHIDVARLLLQRGADPNVPNNIGESPMYWATINCNWEMKDLLVQYGAPFRGKSGRPRFGAPPSPGT
jgi:ankyrin repeat protein